MKKFLLFIILIMIFSITFSEAISFEHSNIFYPMGYKELAIKIGNKFESIRNFVVDLFSYDPGKVNIFIEPNTVITNGYANFLQNNIIKIYTWPPSGYEFTYLPLDDWYTYLLIHEFTHIVTLKKLEGINKLTSNLKMPYLPYFGNFSYEAPTVFSESMKEKNSGRLNNPNISEELFKTFGENFPNDSLMNDFRYGLVFYNANAGFFRYLIEKYGKETVLNYLDSSMRYSFNWLEIILAPSMPYLLLTKLPILLQDNFKSHFGDSYKNEVKNWLRQYKNLGKPQGTLIYNGENERIYKVIIDNDNLYILSSSFGAVSGYFNHPINKLTVMSKDGHIQKIYYLSAIDFKVENGKIFILKRNKNKTEIWELTENKKLISGKISSFDVYNGNIIFSLYDDKKDISIIYLLNKEYVVNGFVREIAFNGNSLYLLIGNSILKLENEAFKVLDNVSMKGAFLKKKGKDIYMIAKIEGKMELIKVEEKFIKLTNNQNIIDADIDNKDIYFISYLENGQGMGIYKGKIENYISGSYSVSLKNDINNYSYKELTNFEELKFYLTPSIFAPFFFTTYFLPISPEDLGISGWALGAVFDFTNTNIDFYLSPYLANFSTYTPDNNSYSVANYNMLGTSFGFVYNSILNDKSIISINLNDFKNSIFTGTTSLSFKLFEFTPSFDSKVSFRLENLSSYLFTNSAFNINNLLSFNITLSKEKFSLGIGESNEFTYESSALSIHSTIYLAALNIISQESYLYGNISIDDENLVIYTTMIYNLFPFYKQAGIAFGYLGNYNYQKNSLNNNLVLYSYIGHPKSNILYLHIGVLFDGLLKPFIGLGTSPHGIF